MDKEIILYTMNVTSANVSLFFLSLLKPLLILRRWLNSVDVPDNSALESLFFFF